VPDGVYFYRLDTPGFRDVKKAVVALARENEESRVENSRTRAGAGGSPPLIILLGGTPPAVGLLLRRGRGDAEDVGADGGEDFGLESAALPLLQQHLSLCR